MQVSTPQEQANSSRLSRKVGYFLLPPLVTLALLTLLLAFMGAEYRGLNKDRILTGVSIGDVDVSNKTAEEARAALAELSPRVDDAQVTFIDEELGEEWSKSYAELGMAYDDDEAIAEAMGIGRSGGPLARLKDSFSSWYYGSSVAPVIVFDESKLDQTVLELASEIDQPAENATISYNNNAAEFNPGQPGRSLDTADLRTRLQEPLSQYRDANVELLVHETIPTYYDDASVAQEIQQVLSGPISFYLVEPLDEGDLEPVVLPLETLASWLRVEVHQEADGSFTQEVLVDENAVRYWLSPYADQIYRDPINARFYFDDSTRELVLVSPHINGRQLDLEGTVQQFLSQVRTSNRAVPFSLEEIVPIVNADATAAELGITELITETTTWFYGSTDARKHNIARAAANFFGVVVAPGEEFSFNKYLGSVSEADGFEEGLIIVGGRTIEGIGGGVCQVSTTLYQSAFLAGFPITERWEHGYMVHYYDDGEGPGMDATVFSPIVDMKFINNTPHHLLIENYYNTEFEALTFKLYSTSMGREVEKSEPVFSDVVPPPEEDVWEFDPNLEEGTVKQIDWAVEGARVTVDRVVRNADGDVMIDETVVSNYIPYPNVFRYGPGVEPYDYSLVPEDS
jgi:vancomycin resistance protein YoaR